MTANQAVEPILIHSERVVLRRLAMSDLEAFLTYRSDPHVARYQSWDSISEPEARNFIEQHAIQEVGVPGQWVQLAIANAESGQLIGDCGLRVHVEDNRQATVGITISRPNQGAGLGLEALSTLFDFGFTQLKLHRIEADTDPANLPARKLMERLGMRREGHFQRSLWFKGRWADEYFYGILGDEWQKRRVTLSSRT